MHKTTKTTINNARQLRKRMTDAELLLWSKIRHEQLGIKFRKQVPISHYIIDFYSYDCNLAIELDGSQHIDNHDYDAIRTEYLESLDIKVLRFWNHKVLTNIDAVLSTIQQNIGQRLP
ncbi:MAG: endonuclease domain-containing protein [Gammaproteobacteria bacterium]|nr:endonuclease domain-containing protein [Gammaproteobacteria bacterium]